MYGSIKSESDISFVEEDISPYEGALKDVPQTYRPGISTLIVIFVFTVGSLLFVAVSPTLGENREIFKTNYFGLETQFKLSSSAFGDNDYLPAEFTCDGEDGIGYNPPFSWTGIPAGTQSFALILTTFSNLSSTGESKADWALFNIPSTVTFLPTGCSSPPQDHSINNFTSCSGYEVGTPSLNVPYRTRYYYVSPCSEGAGLKYYEWTLYALREVVHPKLSLSSSNDEDDAVSSGYQYAGFTTDMLLEHLDDLSLGSTALRTMYVSNGHSD